VTIVGDDNGNATALDGLACPAVSSCVAAFQEIIAAEGQPGIVLFSPLSPVTAPTIIHIRGAQNQTFVSFSCPSVTQCTGVSAVNSDNRIDDEITLDPTTPTITPQVVKIAPRDLSGVSCPSTSQCTAVRDGAAVTFDPNSPYSVQTFLLTKRTRYDSIACPSTSQCTALGDLVPPRTSFGTATVSTFDPAKPGSVRTISLPGFEIGRSEAIACPTTTECVAVTLAGIEFTFDPQSPGKPAPAIVPGAKFYSPSAARRNGPLSISCPSAAQCTATNRDAGVITTFNPTALMRGCIAPNLDNLRGRFFTLPQTKDTLSVARAIKQAGCRLGQVRRLRPSPCPPGLVLNEQPASGDFAPRGIVNLVIGQPGVRCS
jgi:hypothetical protein